MIHIIKKTFSKHQGWFLLCLFCAVNLFLIRCEAVAGGVCKEIKSADKTGVENEQVSLAFDKATGALVSVKNLAASDEYLKELTGGGNPFRLYLGPNSLPQRVAGTDGHVPQRGHYRVKRLSLDKYLEAKKVKPLPDEPVRISRARQFPKVRNHLGL